MTKKDKQRVQLMSLDGTKRTVRLQGASSSDVKEFKRRAQSIRKTLVAGFPLQDADARYITNASEKVQLELKKLGLMADAVRECAEYQLGPFLSRVSELGGETSSRKKTNVATKLQRYFGQGKDIRTITALEAEEFRAALVKKWKLCETSTVPRHIGYAHQMFQLAVKSRLISENPFAEQKKTVKTNREKWHYITKEETKAIWEMLETDADKLRFLLLRYLGLRAPSELNALTWECFDWEAGTVLIKAQKTKHHKDGGFRRCPFGHPDILPLLKKFYESRKGPKASVLPHISHAALTRKVQRWLGRAGLPLWHQLLTNFRRSAGTDARDVLPAHVAAAAFGHSDEVFRSHYGIQTTEHVKAFGDMPSLIS